MSIIALEGMEFYSYHGYYDEEQRFGGKYLVDIYLTTDLDSLMDMSDNLEETINYERVYGICKEIMGIKTRLIETIGYRIMERVLQLSVRIQKVRIRVSKLNPPLLGKVNRTYIEVEKENPIFSG